MKGILGVAFFIHFIIWGCFLLTFSGYLASVGLGAHIGTFYSMMGMVSLFMPLLIGMLADRYILPKNLLRILTLGTAVAFTAFGLYCKFHIAEGNVPLLLFLFILVLLFFIPSIPLLNSIAFSALKNEGYDSEDVFPYIRVAGTVGFIFGMLLIEFCHFGTSHNQMLLAGGAALTQTLFCTVLPSGRVQKNEPQQPSAKPSMLKVVRDFHLVPFLLVTVLSGCCLLVTEAYTVPAIAAKSSHPEYADTFCAAHSNLLISFSRVSEVFCFFILPFFLRRFGVKNVLTISFGTYVIYFLSMAFGNPGSGLSLYILGMLVYGVAFNFYYVPGAIWLDKTLGDDMKGTAQGLFAAAYSGVGSFLCLIPGLFFSHYSYGSDSPDWIIPWCIMAAVALAAMIFIRFVKIKQR